MEPARRILIINGKGGCGKTTIATNLAVAYATRGDKVVIMDHDSQASATEWAEQRPAHLPKVHLVRAHQRVSMYQTQSYHLRIPDNTSHIIVDAASLSAERNIDDLIRQADIIVVPMLPSSIDIRAGSKFIAELLTHRAYRRKPLPVGVVANRTRAKTVAYDKLFKFLRCLDVPTVACFSDSTLYTDAAEHGTGIHDANPTAKSADEFAEWRKLMTWIDTQAGGAQLRRSSPIRASIRERIAAKSAG